MESQGKGRVTLTRYAANKVQVQKSPRFSIVGRGIARKPVRSKFPLKTRTISLLVVDDNRIFRSGLQDRLVRKPLFKLVAAVGTSAAALRAMHRRKPAVILMDFGAGGTHSLQRLRRLRHAAPSAKLITMGIHPAHADILALVKEGVSGFLTKDATLEEFIETIRTVAQGGKVLPRALAESLFSEIVDEAARRGRLRHTTVKMTKRERAVVDLIVHGMSNKEIAAELNIAIDTVKSHVHNILEKLSLRTRLEIAAHARTESALIPSRRSEG